MSVLRVVLKLIRTALVGALFGAASGGLMHLLGVKAKPLGNQLPMLRDGVGVLEVLVLALFGVLHSLAGPVANRRRHRLVWHVVASAVFMLSGGVFILLTGQTVVQLKVLVAVGCALFAAMLVMIDYVQQHHPVVLVYACPMAAAFGGLSYAVSLHVIDRVPTGSPLVDWLTWGAVFGGLLWLGIMLTKFIVVAEERIEHRASLEERADDDRLSR